MIGSKGKSFSFKHFFDVLQHLPKWQLRDQETTPNKGSIVNMHDSEDEKDGGNNDNPRKGRRPKRG
jgi:hypothetical protein